MRNIGRIMACVCLFAVLGAAQSGGVAPRSGPKSAPKAAPQNSDAQIEAAIRAKFAASKISTNHFQVHVQGGVATLEGRTDVVQHKGTATRLAKTGGAVAVNNRIQVSDAGKKKASANLQEGRRRAQVKRSEVRSEPPPPRK